MLHKKLLDRVGLFDEDLEVCEDYDLWLRIASKEKIALIDEKLINKYAGHDEQLGFRKNMDRVRIAILQKLIASFDCNKLRKEQLQRECSLKKELR
jgi:protein associated with RNAse G/E